MVTALTIPLIYICSCSWTNGYILERNISCSQLSNSVV